MRNFIIGICFAVGCMAVGAYAQTTVPFVNYLLGLPTASTPLAGTEPTVIIQSGVAKQVSANSILPGTYSSNLTLAGVVTSSNFNFTGPMTGVNTNSSIKIVSSPASPTQSFSVVLNGGIYSDLTGGGTGLLASFFGGGPPSSFITKPQPLVALSEQEAMTGVNNQGGENSVLVAYANGFNVSTSTANNAQVSGITAVANQNVGFSGDATAILGIANQLGTGSIAQSGYAAFGGFFEAVASNVSSSADSISVLTQNQSGVDATWATYVNQAKGAGTPNMFGIDIDGAGGNMNTAAVEMRGQWDAGIGFTGPNSTFRTYYLVAPNATILSNGIATFPRQFLVTQTPTSGTGLGLGGTTVTNTSASCNVAGASGCLTISVSGTSRQIPFF